jgi:undecaprenyl-diphosphatase
MTGPAPIEPAAAVAPDAAADLPAASAHPAAAHPSVRRQPWTLPHVRHWLLLGILLSAAVLALGLAAQFTPGFSAAELGIDQDLSRHHAAALTAVAMALNVVFGPVAGLALIGAGALGIWLFRGGPVKAIGFGLVALSGWVACELFKIIVARQRPNPALLFDPLAPETGSNSFPSGHVCFAVALGFALYFLARGTRWATVTAFAAPAVALIVAWSRLYIGVHYPSDVAASFLSAAAAVVVVTGLWNLAAPRLARRLGAPSGPPSPIFERK